MRKNFLPDDVARCAGVSDEIDGVIYWREGCEECLRRTAQSNGGRVVNMEPPTLITFFCEFIIDNGNAK